MPEIVQPSFLFGTMHVRDKKAFELFELAQQKIDQCAAFATEFNLTEAQSLSHRANLNLPKGVTIADLIVPKKYQRLAKYFKSITGLDIGHFKNSMPMLITNFMAERMMAQDMAVSLDEMLWNYSEEKDKVMLGIESYQEQLEIMEKIPLELQIKSLLRSIKKIKQFRKGTLKMIDVYQQGDIYKLHKLAKRSVGSLRKILLYNRNRVMAERINYMIREQSIFVAIGAGHLAGGKGVLRLLKKKGVKLEAILY